MEDLNKTEETAETVEDLELDYYEEETPREKAIRKRKSYLLTASIVSVVLLAVAIFVPLIICDILSTRSAFFKAYSYVNVYSENNQSAATFVFGLGFTLRHLSEGFVPWQLFLAQWKLIAGVTELGASGGITFLAVITMILTVFVFVTPVVMAVLYLLTRFTKIGIMTTITKYASIVIAAIEAFTVLWFAIIVIGMATKIGSDLGTVYTVNFWDYMSYGAVKLILEAVLSLWLCTINVRLFLNIRRGIPEE